MSDSNKSNQGSGNKFKNIHDLIGGLNLSIPDSSSNINSHDVQLTLSATARFALLRKSYEIVGFSPEEAFELVKVHLQKALDNQ